MLEHSSTTLQLHDGSTLQFPYNTNSNLPLMLPALPNHIGLTFEDTCVLGMAIQCTTTCLSLTSQIKI